MNKKSIAACCEKYVYRMALNDLVAELKKVDSNEFAMFSLGFIEELVDEMIKEVSKNE